MRNLISCRPESFGPRRDRAYEGMQKLGIQYAEAAIASVGEVEQINFFVRR